MEEISFILRYYIVNKMLLKFENAIKYKIM